MFLDIENIGIDTRMLVLGAIEQEIMGKTMVSLAPFWKSLWRPPGVANCWGLFFLMIFRY